MKANKKDKLIYYIFLTVLIIACLKFILSDYCHTEDPCTECQRSGRVCYDPYVSLHGDNNICVLNCTDVIRDEVYKNDENIQED